MKIFTAIWSILLLMGTAHAQEISVSSTGKVIIPADEISFNINLNAEGQTPQEVFKLHKKRESALVDALKKQGIKEQDIKFEPVSMHASYVGRPDEHRQKKITTSQHVQLHLKDFSNYEQIQMTLIKNDFNNFSGNFESSKSKGADDKALAKAIKNARHKANIIAENTHLKITGIKNINYSYNNPRPRPLQTMKMAASNDSSLMQFDQTMSVSAHVSVDYIFAQQK